MTIYGKYVLLQVFSYVNSLHMSVIYVSFWEPDEYIWFILYNIWMILLERHTMQQRNISCFIILGLSSQSGSGWDDNSITKINKMNCELMLTYDTPALRQTGSRNLTGPKTLPTIWHTYMKIVTKYQIPVINSYLEKCDEKCAYTNVCLMCIKINKIGNRK
jgi:hypothetical protein